MEPLKCGLKGCPNTHKSTTGYCVEHAHLQTKHTVAERNKLFGTDGPVLAEEKRWRHE